MNGLQKDILRVIRRVLWKLKTLPSELIELPDESPEFEPDPSTTAELRVPRAGAPRSRLRQMAESDSGLNELLVDSRRLPPTSSEPLDRGPIRWDVGGPSEKAEN